MLDIVCCLRKVTVPKGYVGNCVLSEESYSAQTHNSGYGSNTVFRQSAVFILPIL
jgi:hypothetical protein